MFVFYSDTARMVKSQNDTVVESLMFLFSIKSSKSQHLLRMIGEWGHIMSRFLNISMIASYT